MLASAVVLAAAPANAHTALVSSSPASGAKLDSPPDHITLTFSDAIEQTFAVVTVTGPNNVSYQRDNLRVEGRDVTIGVKPLDQAASYTVAFRVVSADGHPIAYEYSFELTKAATPAPAETRSSTQSAATPTPASAPNIAANNNSGAGLAAWLIACAACIALIAIAVIVYRRSRGRPDLPESSETAL
ncbi:copper resistance CopC family protein [Mycobacterium sp. 050128]|uniref:copper resistance CopC family protein n=1 Tax=Mycobacterium sp. 050128 TaxID=3096112 RepID=UPI002ED944E0